MGQGGLEAHAVNSESNAKRNGLAERLAALEVALVVLELLALLTAPRVVEVIIEFALAILELLALLAATSVAEVLAEFARVVVELLTLLAAPLLAEAALTGLDEVGTKAHAAADFGQAAAR